MNQLGQLSTWNQLNQNVAQKHMPQGQAVQAPKFAGQAASPMAAAASYPTARFAGIPSMANMLGAVPQHISRGDKVFCPLRTELAHSCQEEAAAPGEGEVMEIKAYKLGKKRWSYNQVDVVLKEKGGKRELYSKQAIHKGVAANGLGEMGGISYQVTLNNNEVIQVHTFLVYADGQALGSPSASDAEKNEGKEEAAEVRVGSKRTERKRKMAGAKDEVREEEETKGGNDEAKDKEKDEEKEDTATDDDNDDTTKPNKTDNTTSTTNTKAYEWELVNRGDCKRGCVGSTLRALQRFGRLGKRTGSNCNTPRSAGPSQVNSAASTPGAGNPPGTTPSSKLDRSFSNMKDARFMYLSLDEAVTHCGPASTSTKPSKAATTGARCFRLVCGAYAGTELIATSVSPPIRVLANNDVPGGAAHIEIQLEVDSSWPGWDSSFEPLELQFSQGTGAQGYGQGGHSQMPQSMSISGMQSIGSLQSMPSMNQQGFNQSIGSMHSMPSSANLPSPSTRDVGLGGRIHSDESMITPNRLGNQLRKTMSVSSCGHKRVSSSLLEGKDDEMVLRRTQSMKKGKPTINLTASTGTHDVARGLASPFVKMQGVGREMDAKKTTDSLLMGGIDDVAGNDAVNNQQDAVSAFVELMMTTFDSPNGNGDDERNRVQVPVVEIPDENNKPSPLNLAAIDVSYLDSLLKVDDPTFFSVGN